MAKLGMDDEAVRSLAGQLDGHAKAIIGLVGQVEGVVSRMRTTWHGHDADAFTGWWHNQHRPAMQRAHDSICGLAQSARNNATAQESASSPTADVHAGGVAAHAGQHSSTVKSAPPPSLDGYHAAYANHDPALRPYDEGQCTSWAVYRREQLGLPLPPNIPNGENGFQMAGHIGLVEPDQAGQGSLVSLTNGNNHVMVIERVGVPTGGDRHTFVVSEMNALGRNDGTDFSPNSTLVEHANATWTLTNVVDGVSRSRVLASASVQISAVR
jgi:WXG100 family type VII secretion target